MKLNYNILNLIKKIITIIFAGLFFIFIIGVLFDISRDILLIISRSGFVAGILLVGLKIYIKRKY